MYDIIIKNGLIIDGTGEKMYRNDIGIRGDKIAKIGDLHGEAAELEVDAIGKAVCPGFVDVNNHSDTYWQLFLSPNLESLVYQGVTTIVGGNCGSSLAPLVNSKDIETIQKWADIKRVNVNWLRMKEFLAVLDEKHLPINFATLTGHGTIRRGVSKDESRNMSTIEFEAAKRMLSDSMDEGSLGISTGLIYTHARLAPTEELVDLAKIVKKKNGVYTTHIRGEGNDLLESLEEAMKIAQESGVKLHISHLKAMGEKNWDKMKEAIAIIDHAHSIGIDVSFDVYPYTSTGSVLYTLLPAWVSEGGKRMMLYRLKDPTLRKEIAAEMISSEIDWSKVEISISPLNKTLTRRKITDIAESQGKSVEDAVIDMLIACEGRIITTMEILNEDNVVMALKHPLSFISSNGSGYSVNHGASGEIVHPRNFGTFPKLFSQYVRYSNLFSWEEAVKKVTGAPAAKFGIKNRGVLKEGNFSDIVIMDMDKIESPASKENPYQYSKGIDYVFVNGKAILLDGQFTGAKNGLVVRH
jgi:N-acyl-D-amino-acid deacylase